MKDEDYRYVLFLRNSKIYRNRKSNIRKIKKELKKQYQLFTFCKDWTKDELIKIKKLHHIQEYEIKNMISVGEPLIDIDLYINEEDYENKEKEEEPW